MLDARLAGTDNLVDESLNNRLWSLIHEPSGDHHITDVMKPLTFRDYQVIRADITQIMYSIKELRNVLAGRDPKSWR